MATKTKIAEGLALYEPPEDAHQERAAMPKRSQARPSDRPQRQIRRVLLLVDTLAPYRYWHTIPEIADAIRDRGGEKVSERTINRDLRLLESLGLAESRGSGQPSWRLNLRESESVQAAALKLCGGVAPRSIGQSPRKVRQRVTEEEAQEILDSTLRVGELAERFDLSISYVYKIKTRKAWGHLTPSRERQNERRA